MATAGQLHAWQLPIVEVVMISTTTSTKYSKPPPTLILLSPPHQVSRKSATGPAAAAGIHPSVEPVRRRRQWPRGGPVHLARPTSKSGGRAQDVFLFFTPHLWPKKPWWWFQDCAPSREGDCKVVLGHCTIARRRLQGARRIPCCSNPLPSPGFSLLVQM